MNSDISEIKTLILREKCKTTNKKFMDRKKKIKLKPFKKYINYLEELSI